MCHCSTVAGTLWDTRILEIRDEIEIEIETWSGSFFTPLWRPLTRLWLQTLPAYHFSWCLVNKASLALLTHPEKSITSFSWHAVPASPVQLLRLFELRGGQESWYLVVLNLWWWKRMFAARIHERVRMSGRTFKLFESTISNTLFQVR